MCSAGQFHRVKIACTRKNWKPVKVRSPIVTGDGLVCWTSATRCLAKWHLGKLGTKHAKTEQLDFIYTSYIYSFYLWLFCTSRVNETYRAMRETCFVTFIIHFEKFALQICVLYTTLMCFVLHRLINWTKILIVKKNLKKNIIFMRKVYSKAKNCH